MWVPAVVLVDPRALGEEARGQTTPASEQDQHARHGQMGQASATSSRSCAVKRDTGDSGRGRGPSPVTSSSSEAVSPLLFSGPIGRARPLSTASARQLRRSHSHHAGLTHRLQQRDTTHRVPTQTRSPQSAFCFFFWTTSKPSSSTHGGLLVRFVPSPIVQPAAAFAAFARLANSASRCSLSLGIVLYSAPV